MPVKASYPGYSSEAEYRAALAEQLAAKAVYEAANDSRFDAAVRRLAPLISELRKDTARRSTRKLAERLNAMGQAGPNGKPLTSSTMRRILLRLPELHLGEGPSDRSTAASDRRLTRYYPRLNIPIKGGGLKKALSLIDEAEGKTPGGPA
jgi:hypothetical protein